MSLTPEQRRLRAQVAANARLSREDPRDITAPARKAALERFEREVDPDGTLSPEERARRAYHARRSYFLRLALASSRARAAARLSAERGGDPRLTRHHSRHRRPGRATASAPVAAAARPLAVATRHRRHP
ncbi:hypothetical protein [Streptomyces sp. P17]|uniref:hypothetical protein n=1 Tax=Streptomyces sp. P17 TaxID=3074716 RepID=UPI0028F450A8|nr:hypothetical protein [Streptomyces sp. P17]MDT9694739.1 hypothetical protein [Streptomyces sp. P17]